MNEVDKYTNIYMQWRGLEQSKEKAEIDEALKLRQKMRKIEDTVSHE